jgi:hypothetical protein
MNAGIGITAALLLITCAGCADRDEPQPSALPNADGSTATSTQTEGQANPPVSVPAPEDPAGPPPSPAAAPAAAAAPECKESPMREQACKPADTGDPNQKPVN